MSCIVKLWKHRLCLRSIFSTVYFNFHYLPLKYAWKLPIVFYKPKFKSLKGSVSIDTPFVKTGMIRLGFPCVCLYPNSGIVFENLGGQCVFKGDCSIGNSSAISIGAKGNLIIGDGFQASAALKLVSYCHLEFKEDVGIGWDNIFMDTDLHKLTTVHGRTTKGYGPVVIGKNAWFGLRCTTLKNTKTPNFCLVSSNSVLDRNYRLPSNILLSGHPAKLKAEGIFMNKNDHHISYN